MKTTILLLTAFIVQPICANDLYDDTLCPIPYQLRIPNRTGSQCVWSSIETIGRWIGEKKLYNITTLQNCQGTAEPRNVQKILKRLDVKYEQSYRNKKHGRELIEKAMKLGCGCIFGANGTHAMVLIHYDIDGNRVHYIDNVGDRYINKILSIKEFEQIWDSWVIIIEPPEAFQSKINNRMVRMWHYDK